jgi:hypothetical protein
MPRPSPHPDAGGHETVLTRRTCVGTNAGLDASIAMHLLLATSATVAPARRSEPATDLVAAQLRWRACDGGRLAEQ